MQNQPTLYVRDGVAGKDRALVDASALSEDGTTALDWWFPSKDGALLAWGRSESGSEESTLFVRDVTTPAHINGCQRRTLNPAIPLSLPKLSDGFVSADHLAVWRERDRVGCVHRGESLGVAACEGLAELGVCRLDGGSCVTHALVVPFRSCVRSRRNRSDQRAKDNRSCGQHAHLR